METPSSSLLQQLPPVTAMWCTLNFARHRLAFPAVLVSIPAIFHIVRLACGVSLQQAADAFWSCAAGGEDCLSQRP